MYNRDIEGLKGSLLGLLLFHMKSGYIMNIRKLLGLKSKGSYDVIPQEYGTVVGSLPIKVDQRLVLMTPDGRILRNTIFKIDATLLVTERRDSELPSSP